MNTIIQKKVFRNKRNHTIFPKLENCSDKFLGYCTIGIIGCGVIGSFKFSYDEIVFQKKCMQRDYIMLVMQSFLGFVVGVCVGVSPLVIMNVGPVVLPFAIPPLICHMVTKNSE